MNLYFREMGKLVLLFLILSVSSYTGDRVNMGHINTNGVKLYYEVYGEGEPLLLIAGLASDSQSWATVISSFSDDRRVIVFDNRGVGRSTPQYTPTSISKIADDAVRLLDHLNIDSSDIVGHSMGGFVALDMANRYPSRVRKMVLVATSSKSNDKNGKLFKNLADDLSNGIDPKVWFTRVFELIFTKKLLSDNSVVDEMLDYSIEYPYPQSVVSFANQVEAIREFDCSGDLKNIKAPTLLVCGAEDVLFTPEESIGMLSGIAGICSVVIEGAAHSVHLEKSDEFVKCVIEFLENN